MDINYKRVAKNAGFRIDVKRGDDLRNFPLEKARIQVFIIPLYCMYFGDSYSLFWTKYRVYRHALGVSTLENCSKAQYFPFIGNADSEMVIQLVLRQSYAGDGF